MYCLPLLPPSTLCYTAHSCLITALDCYPLFVRIPLCALCDTTPPPSFSLLLLAISHVLTLNQFAHRMTMYLIQAPNAEECGFLEPKSLYLQFYQCIYNTLIYFSVLAQLQALQIQSLLSPSILQHVCSSYNKPEDKWMFLVPWLQHFS